MSSAFESWESRRLWSLWDIMRKFDAGAFWKTATGWHDSKVSILFDDARREYGEKVEMPEDEAEKLGALPNTETYITCRLKLQEMAQTQWAAQNMQLQQQRMNEQSVNNQPIFFPGFKPFHLPPPRHFEMPKRTNCTSQVIGDQLQTNCQEQ